MKTKKAKGSWHPRSESAPTQVEDKITTATSLVRKWPRFVEESSYALS